MIPQGYLDISPDCSMCLSWGSSWFAFESTIINVEVFADLNSCGSKNANNRK